MVPLAKCILAGLFLVVAAAILFPLSLLVASLFLHNQSEGASIGFDVVSIGRNPLIWTVAAVVFLAGYLWEYNRIKPH